MRYQDRLAEDIRYRRGLLRRCDAMPPDAGKDGDWCRTLNRRQLSSAIRTLRRLVKERHA